VKAEPDQEGTGGSRSPIGEIGTLGLKGRKKGGKEGAGGYVAHKMGQGKGAKENGEFLSKVHHR